MKHRPEHYKMPYLMSRIASDIVITTTDNISPTLII